MIVIVKKMHLCELYPKFSLMTPDNVKKLKGFNISTVQDLLSRDPEKLVNILDASYTEVSKLQDELFISLAGYPESSLEIYQRRVQDEIVLKSGASHLDTNILQGGFKTGYIYEVYGLAGAGKSQLCFSLAVEGIRAAAGMGVCFIDTKNDLAPERILQILQARTEDSSNLNMLNRIKVHKCFTAVDLLKTLRLLTEKLKRKENAIRLVIVDNIVSTILSILTEDVKMASFYSSKMTQCLQKLASLGCCVVTANNARYFGGQLNPALGKIWSKLADVRLQLEYSQARGTRVVTVVKGGANQTSTQSSQTLVKGVAKQSSRECTFIIDKSGVH